MWLAIVVAQVVGDGLQGFFYNLALFIENPLELQWTDKTLPMIGIFGAIYIAVVSSYESQKGTTRDGEEHGSARWGSPPVVNAQFAQSGNNNIQLTEHVKIGLDTTKHGRCLNTLVIGGSGSGKTRYYALGNILNANTSYVITDPKQEILNNTGRLLKIKGYEVKVLNLVNFDVSDGYNPFQYIRDEKDVLKLVNNLILSTTPKNAHEGDPFWTKSETALLQAIILLLHSEAPVCEQNFSMVMRMLEYAEVKEEDEEFESPLDMLFESLDKEKPGHIAVRQYKVFKQAAGKTAKSILVSVAVRLAPFNLEQVKRITDHDDMELGLVGERKIAVFAVIPDNDSTFNFIVSLLYNQLFQTLYYSADQEHQGRLPVPVHFILDEFASITLPSYTRELATMRSRQIFASTLIQNLVQIKEKFKDSWETIPGNSDSLLYLGGNEATSHKFISDGLGKQNLRVKTHGQTKGRSGSYTTNFQTAGRELLLPNEVRLLDNKKAILLIRGAMPVMDQKFNIKKHPNYIYTMESGAPPYVHKTRLYTGQPFIVYKDKTEEKIS